MLLLPLFLAACSGSSAEQRQQYGPSPTSEQGAIQQEHIDAILRTCERKAHSSIRHCWTDEYERTKNRSLEARITLMLVISPEGRAQDVKIVASTSQSKPLEQCVVEEARSWAYPEGSVTATINCSFYLKSSM